MGVRGLTTFVALCNLAEHKVKKFQPPGAQQQQQQAKIKIVVDGYALLYFIYFSRKIDIISGGQFDQLEHEMTVFLKAILRAGFSPYVIFDGIHPEKKQQENISRQESSIYYVTKHLAILDAAPNKQIFNNSILPILSQQAMINVLNQLKVPYSVSDAEADAVTGTHANNNGCAVLSKDSDFFVFNVHQGYIPLDSMRVFNDKLTFDHFRTENLVSFLKLNPVLLPAFASLCGNDFVSRESLWPFHSYLRKEIPAASLSNFPEKCWDIARVGIFLTKFSSQEEAFEAVVEITNKFFEENAEALKSNGKIGEPEAEPEKELAEKLENTTVNETEGEKEKEGEEKKGEEKAGETKEGTEKAEGDVLVENGEENAEKHGEVVEDGADIAKEANKEAENERAKILTMDPAARKTYLLSLFAHSAQEYIPQNVTVGKDTSLVLHPLLVPRYNNSTAIPLPILHHFRQSLFNVNLMEVLSSLSLWCEVVIDNTDKVKNVWLASLPIRKILYGILCGGGQYAESASNVSVTEFLREG